MKSVCTVDLAGRPARQTYGEMKPRMIQICEVNLKSLNPEPLNLEPLNRERLQKIVNSQSSIVNRLLDEGKVRVLLNLINYDAKVEAHYSQVEKIA